MEALRKIIADLKATYGRLQPRERRFVLFGGVGALFLLLVLVSISISSSQSRQEARIQTKLTQLEEVRRSTGGYRAAEQQRASLESRLRAPPVKLFSLLEEQGKKQGIEISGMVDKGIHPVGESKINEISVELTLNKLPLDKLVRFLSELESGQALVKVTRLQIRPRLGDSAIDASLVVSTYQLEA